MVIATYIVASIALAAVVVGVAIEGYLAMLDKDKERRNGAKR